MGRPVKVGADFFLHQVKRGSTLFAMEQKWGNDGYAFWFKLLELLSNQPDHCFHVQADSPSWVVFLAMARVDEATAMAMLGMLAKLGAIDRELWEEGSMVWSQNLVNSFSRLYDKRKKALPCRPPRQITGIVSAPETPVPAPESTGNGELPAPKPRLRARKVHEEERRGEERRGEKIYPPAFEVWWEVYPRRIEKKGALAKWTATLKRGATESDLLVAARTYASECRSQNRDEKYIKHPTTFLGPAEPWRDYVNGHAKPANPNPPMSRCERGHLYITEDGYCRYCAKEDDHG